MIILLVFLSSFFLFTYKGKGRDMSAMHLKYYDLLTKALLGANAETKKVQL